MTSKHVFIQSEIKLIFSLQSSPNTWPSNLGRLAKQNQISFNQRVKETQPPSTCTVNGWDNSYNGTKTTVRYMDFMEAKESHRLDVTASCTKISSKLKESLAYLSPSDNFLKHK